MWGFNAWLASLDLPLLACAAASFAVFERYPYLPPNLLTALLVELVHKGDWSQIKDVSRIVLYYPDASSLLEGLEKLQKAFRCLRVVNHFRHPTVLGWRDVTVFVEESVEACNRARHICEIRLQLNGYAIVRKHAHHYFELIRKVIVSCAKVSLASNRLKLLATLLDAIESTPPPAQFPTPQQRATTHVAMWLQALSDRHFLALTLLTLVHMSSTACRSASELSELSTLTKL